MNFVEKFETFTKVTQKMFLDEFGFCDLGQSKKKHWQDMIDLLLSSLGTENKVFLWNKVSSLM